MRLITIVLIIFLTNHSNGQTIAFYSQGLLEKGHKFERLFDDGSMWYSRASTDTAYFDSVSADGQIHNLWKIAYHRHPNHQGQVLHRNYGIATVYYTYDTPGSCSDCAYRIVTRFDTSGSVLWIDTVNLVRDTIPLWVLGGGTTIHKGKNTICVKLYDIDGDISTIDVDWNGNYIRRYFSPEYSRLKYKLQSGKYLSSYSVEYSPGNTRQDDRVVVHASNSLRPLAAWVPADRTRQHSDEVLWVQSISFLDSTHISGQLAGEFGDQTVYLGVGTQNPDTSYSWARIPDSLYQNSTYMRVGRGYEVALNDSLFLVGCRHTELGTYPTITNDYYRFYTFNKNTESILPFWDTDSTDVRIRAVFFIHYLSQENAFILDLHEFIPQDSIQKRGVMRIEDFDFVSNPVSVFPTNMDTRVFIYPNPTSGQFILESEEAGEYRIYNLGGQLVQVGRFIKGTNTLEIDNGFPHGVYSIHLKTNAGKMSTRKLILSN